MLLKTGCLPVSSRKISRRSAGFLGPAATNLAQLLYRDNTCAVKQHRLLALSMLACSLPGGAWAQEARAVPSKGTGAHLDYLGGSLGVDATITGFAAAAWVAAERLRPELAPSTCRWCAPPGFDASAQHSLAWSNRRAADRLSDGVAYGLIPVSTLSIFVLNSSLDQQQPLEQLIQDGLIIAQATAFAADLGELAKLSVARERPFVHDIPGSQKGDTPKPADNNLSFYSAHTNISMAVAVSASTVASLRGYRFAPALWITLPALSLVAGYLRVASQQHYVSDVAAGAVMGAAVGFAVPYWLHGGSRLASSSPSGSSVSPFVWGNASHFVLGASGTF